MSDVEPLVDMLSALGQRTRLDAYGVVAAAGAEGITATEIANRLEVAPNTLSSHLAILVRSGLTDQEREGRFIRYRADTQKVKVLAGYLLGLQREPT